MKTSLDKYKKKSEEKKDTGILGALSSGQDERPITLSIRIPKREKDRITGLAATINRKEKPATKLTQTALVLTAVQLLEKQLLKSTYLQILNKLEY